MATLTKTFTEHSADPGAARSTWTVTATANNYIATGSSVTINMPVVTAKYSHYTGKNWARIEATGLMVFNNDVRIPRDYTYNASLAGNTVATLTRSGAASTSIDTIDLFNSNNSNVKTLNVTYTFGGAFRSATNAAMNPPYGVGSLDESSMGTICTITLDAPPTFSSTQVTFNTTEVLQNKTTASVNISNLSAKYGGTISSVVLKIGNQTASRTNNGVLSIDLNTAGDFVPTITVTDSRGQVSIQNLNQITVLPYQPVNIVIKETDRITGAYKKTTDTSIDSSKTYYTRSGDGISTPHTYTIVSSPSVSNLSSYYETTGHKGQKADEGTSASIVTQFTWSVDVASLVEPIVKVDNTIYQVDWYVDENLSNKINDWSLVVPLDEGESRILYGYIDDMFDTQASYLIGITPNDTEGVGTEITQTLDSAYYTIDFLAGGHGVAFGRAATETGFHCGLDAHFYERALDDNGIVTVHLMPTSTYNWEVDNPNHPSTNQYGVGYGIVDSTSMRVSNLDTHKYDDGKVGTVLGVHRVINNEDVRNQIYLYIDDNGNKSYWLDDRQAFRNMLFDSNTDFVTEQGTSGIWRYRKWKSGTAECWALTSSTNYSITSGYGNGYYANLPAVSFPSGLFNAAPSLQATRANAGSAQGLIFISCHSVTASGFGAFISSLSSGTFACQFAYHAIGRYQ